MDRLKGKVALISGGARGQGAAEARLFVGEGAKVVVGDVLDDQAKALADGINKKAGARVIAAVHLDVTRAADWRAAVETCEREFGGLDILVNNAGIARMGGVDDTTEEEWDAVININQKGVWLGMKAGVPAMRRRGGGSIVNISSIYGLIGSPGMAAYHSSKGGRPSVDQIGRGPVRAGENQGQLDPSRRDPDPDDRGGSTERSATIDRDDPDEARGTTRRSRLGGPVPGLRRSLLCNRRRTRS
jgi:hypothetical protein